MRITTILFDFDGVMCHDRFYEKTLLPEHEEVYHWIQVNIFTDTELTDAWMRGEFSYRDINRKIADSNQIEYEELNRLLLESVRLMELDRQMIELVRLLKRRGYKLGMVTDNMDVFSEVTISNHRLDELFGVVINSSDMGFLKPDENGRLVDMALEVLGTEDISRAVLIDDSERMIELFNAKGGRGILFTDFQQVSGELRRLNIL